MAAAAPSQPPSSGQDVIYDGCTAAVHTAYANSDATFIFPITPSTLMSEQADLWAHQGRRNIFDQVCIVRQMQSEAGVAGAVHGGLVVGSMVTTFTASQGLLLMVPNMYKIAGELIPCVFHVSARAVAGQALSIFGDHSDVMAVRQCGWAMLSSSNVQEAMDLSMIAHMSTMKASVPFVHFFDGFRTSHELQKIKMLDNQTMHDLQDHEAIRKFRDRSLNPVTPHLRGTSQGPEVYFQNLEAANKYYEAVPSIVKDSMEQFRLKTGRSYRLHEFYGHPEATDVVVIMGAGSPVLKEVIDFCPILKTNDGIESKLGLVTVHLFRPWSLQDFVSVFPPTVQRVAVLDRTKESGALGEPLWLDVAASFQSVQRQVVVIGGRYGLGSKDFTPAMALAVFQNLQSPDRKHRFTVGIDDDVTHLSLNFKINKGVHTVPTGTRECMFWGMGSDGTVGANKNVIKIIGDNTPLFVQGYFAYSAHKAGGLTVSHLRFGPRPITSQYLIQHADYVACHRDAYVFQYRMLDYIREGGVFVLNCPWKEAELDRVLPAHLRRTMAQKKLKFYTIDASRVAEMTKMGRRVNNILMTVFFKLSGVLPFEEAIPLFKRVIQKTYGKKGDHVVQANWKAVDAAIEYCSEVHYDAEKWLQATDTDPLSISGGKPARKLDGAPSFVTSVLLPLEQLQGDELPVSTFAPFAGGVLPLGTAAYEKRGIALSVPIVDMDKCTQCNYCAFVCPHAAIRPFLVDDEDAEKAPETFIMRKAKGAVEIAGFRYRIQVSPMDCTGCELCAIACPDDCLTMTALPQVRDVESKNWDFAINLTSREDLCEGSRFTLKGSQFYTPLIEFSGACEGCGETPYIKLLTQLFGERMVIANATGCSSIYGASYPSVPYTKNQKGYGPAWGNSLFEDNAEYGYGMIVATGHRRERFHSMVEAFLREPRDCSLSDSVYEKLEEFAEKWKSDSSACMRLYEELSKEFEAHKGKNPALDKIGYEKTMIPKVCYWIIGGDGWAYDIGYGGLDHVIASNIDVNILVLDTEVYSNTGGQTSKSTSMGAVHKFSAGGCTRQKKDLPMIAMEYGSVYVASVSSSANMSQTVRAFVEAERYNGPSIIMAYSPCIEHGYIKPFSSQGIHCKLAVESGYWPLYRYNPELIAKNEAPLQLDSKKIKADVREFFRKENRFEQLNRTNPQVAREMEEKVYEWVHKRFARIKALAEPPTLAAAEGRGTGAPDVTYVLYGSETGNAEDTANHFAHWLKDRQQLTKVLPLDEVEVEELAEAHHVVVFCSTAGQGEFPANGKELYASLSNPDLLSQGQVLAKCNYAVFGLGDSSYIFFNEAAKRYDKRFTELGATRIIPLGLGDDQDEEKYETALCEWAPEYFTERHLPEPQNVSDEPDPPLYRAELLNMKIEYRKCVPLGARSIRMDVNKRLTPEDYEVDVRHLEFDLAETGLRYQLGDSLAIYPETDPTIVQEFCEYFGFDPEQKIKIKRAGTEGSSKHEALFKHPMTVRQLFTECIDICGKPGRSFYEVFYKYCTDPTEKAAAKELLSKECKPVLEKLRTREMVNCFDMMRKFPSVRKRIDIEHAIDLLPLHKPRYYSIASSQKFVGEKRLHLCIGIVDWVTSTGEKRYGACTGYIRRCDPKVHKVYIACSLKPTAFNMPPSDLHPLIMAAMGTGLAPFRAFVQYRAWLKRSGRSCGPITLYYGCRYQKKDFLYGEELQAFKEEGVISDLKVAFSRDQKEKFYVQHHIKNDQRLLYKRLIEEQGYFYLCGSAKQVPVDIRSAVIVALVAQQGVSEKQAADMVNQLQIKGQYNVEAW